MCEDTKSLFLLCRIGFTCFWPNGGGLKEPGPPSSFQQRYQQQQNLWDSEDDDEDEIEELND